MNPRLRLATMVPALISLGFLAIDARADNSSEKEASLPAAVRKTFDAKFPKAQIEKVDAETENGVEVYDFEFKDGDLEKETDIAKDGTLLESTLVIRTKDVPKAAMKAIRKAAGDAKMGRTEKIEVEYELKDGKVIKLAKTELQYAVELTKDGKHAEVTVDPTGKVVEPPQWEADKPEAATK